MKKRFGSRGDTKPQRGRFGAASPIRRIDPLSGAVLAEADDGTVKVASELAAMETPRWPK